MDATGPPSRHIYQAPSTPVAATNGPYGLPDVASTTATSLMTASTPPTSRTRRSEPGRGSPYRWTRSRSSGSIPSWQRQRRARPAALNSPWFRPRVRTSFTDAFSNSSVITSSTRPSHSGPRTACHSSRSVLTSLADRWAAGSWRRKPSSSWLRKPTGKCGAIRRAVTCPARHSGLRSRYLHLFMQS